MQILPAITEAFKEFTAPAVCLVCGRLLDKYNSFGYICGTCFEFLPAAPEPEKIMIKISPNFDADDLSISKFYSLFIYTEGYENIVKSIKYEGFTRLASAFGELLGEKISHCNEAYEGIVPVPIHNARMRERGFNQAELIARGICERMKTPLADILVRNRYTQTQTAMGKKDRSKNVEGAFTLSAGDISGNTFLLVDDVLTTGSTLNTCATTLLENGARSVHAATIAIVV